MLVGHAEKGRAGPLKVHSWCTPHSHDHLLISMVIQPQFNLMAVGTNASNSGHFILPSWEIHIPPGQIRFIHAFHIQWRNFVTPNSGVHPFVIRASLKFPPISVISIPVTPVTIIPESFTRCMLCSPPWVGLVSLPLQHNIFLHDSGITSDIYFLHIL